LRHLLHDLREHLGGIILAALAAAFIGRVLPAGHREVMRNSELEH
jgi:hypothetical protein